MHRNHTHHSIAWTDQGGIGPGSFTLDGHDLSRTLAREGLTVSVQEGRIRADVTLMSDALDVTIQADQVIVHTSREQEALLRAGGWAKKGDVSVNGNLLRAQADIIRVTAAAVTDERLAKGLLDTADRLDGYGIPQQADDEASR